MRVGLFIIGLLLSAVAIGQPVKEYFFLMKMDGKHTLESGHETNIWGFAPEFAEGIDGELRLPSPTIRVQEGDSVVVRVINPSEEGHTIHWHGLDVDQANDGVPAFSQFVLKGDTLHYRFRATHAGNYIYHCHVTTTLHLMMGMYGSFIVDRPDKRVFAGGPRYDRDYDFLGSEMDQSWNDDYTMTGPLNTFEADQFLLNGKSGRQIYEDTAMQVIMQAGDTVLLRLINIGYGIHTYEFPPAVDALVVGSDGRALPQPFLASDLSIYPGERYSVILITSQTTFLDHIRVLYRTMIDRSIMGFNYIPINTNQAPVGMQQGEDIIAFPNPFQHRIDIQGVTQPIHYEVMNAMGQIVQTGNELPIQTTGWGAGYYLLRLQHGGALHQFSLIKSQ